MKTELDRLLDAYLDGTLSAAARAELNARLKHDADARREFVELLNLDSALAALAAGGLAETAPPPRQRRLAAPTRWLAAAAGLVLLGLGTWVWQTTRPAHATVAEAAGVAGLVEGDRLRGGWHRLDAGTLALLSARGARLVLEAPAEFRFETAQRLRLKRGRLAADVPPSAKGFTVVTPTGEAIDLGTRFGIDVPASGNAEVHVFQGEVIAKPNDAGGAQSLRGGDALALQGGAARELRSAAFIQPDEMPGLRAGLAAGQRARAEQALAELRRDPALIALLDFEDDTPQEGNFRVVQGRWPGSQAPEFTELGDHLKLDAGGDRDWPQLTLAAWVRIDRLGAPYQSLLHTDGWEASKPGQVHWMVTRHTTMRLALRGNTLAAGSDETEGSPDSRTPVLPGLGRWLHLATVYDAHTRTVRFYLNGRFDKETRQEVAHPARLGPARIGNWDRQDRKLSGRVDELLLLGRALTDIEIRALFEAGNPYR
jgi:ferric-dicitrate binding protein FerR (iron transport regulator)